MKSRTRTGLAGAVQRLRARAGLSQRELAEKSGLGLSRIKAIESGASQRPRSDAITALASALDVNPGRLLELVAKGEQRRQAEREALGAYVEEVRRTIAARNAKAHGLPPPDTIDRAAERQRELAENEGDNAPQETIQPGRRPRVADYLSADELLARALDAHLSGQRAVAVMFASAYIEMIAEIDGLPISVSRRF